MTGQILIREVAPDDAEAVASLSGELGYPLSTEAARERINGLVSVPDRKVCVACGDDGRVVGWVDVGLTQHLQSEVAGEIYGLVVASEYRNRQIGQQLVARAEQWVIGKGVLQMTVRSRVTREDAHRFYKREGYEIVKTSTVFAKRLQGGQ